MNSLYDQVLTALYGVWNRRWIALGTAWGVCLLGWLVVVLIPNSYESRARIFVQRNIAAALNPAGAVPFGMPVAKQRQPGHA